MFKAIFNATSCMLFGHEQKLDNRLACEYLVEEVVVVGTKIKCKVSVGAEVRELYSCTRCGDTGELSRLAFKRTFHITLNTPYLAGLRTEGLVGKPEVFFDNVLRYPASVILKDDFHFVIMEGLDRVTNWVDTVKPLHEGANTIGYWPIIETDVLAYRDALNEHLENLGRITEALNDYDRSIFEVTK